MKGLTVTEASIKYRVPQRTLRNYVASGLVKHSAVKVGKFRIYYLDETSLKRRLKNKPRRGRPPKR